MKLSTRGRYGLKAMVDLAQSYGSGPVSLSALAQKQGVSDAYLEHLITALKKAGLIRSVRGVQGGYALCIPPRDVSVGRVLRVLEGTTALVQCVESRACTLSNQCATRPLWLRIQKEIDAVVEHTSLQDIVDENQAVREDVQ